jgi:Arc/MetJ-type ribon-helix-helix transcriptional regulator
MWARNIDSTSRTAKQLRFKTCHCVVAKFQRRKPRVVTFRLDEATWDWVKRLAPYTRYGNASSFIREGIDLLLKHEDEHTKRQRTLRQKQGKTPLSSSIFPLDVLLHIPPHLDQTPPNLLKERDHLIDLGIARQLELRLARLCA